MAAHGVFLRWWAAVFLLLLLLAGATAPAMAAPRFCAMAVDAHSGKVLFARDPDGVTHPASLTKVMTLYVLFQEMAVGRVTRDTRFPVSQFASTRAPSKLGLKPGQSIRADDAIRALVTKSANDVATVVAEAISGSEAAFAERMTRTARALGMTRTTFRNASGLPDPQQVTTARDMATLGLRIQRDFPQYFGYFSLRSFTYNGVTHRNHNRMLGRFKGMDGIKTGYIRASGFNLITSVQRDRKRMVGVVLGASSVGVRNRYMAAMLETQFAKASFARGGSIAAAAGDPPGYVRHSQFDTARRTLPRGKAENTEQPSPEQVAAQVAATHLATSEQEAAKQAGARLLAQKAATEKLAAQKQALEKHLMAKQAAERQAATKLAAVAEQAAAEQAAADQVVAQTTLAEEVTAAQQNGAAQATAVPVDPLSTLPSVKGTTFTSVTVEPQEPSAAAEAAEQITVQSGKSDNLASLITPQAEQVVPKQEETPLQDEEAAIEADWNIQIGAFPTKDAAERRIEEARSSGVELLQGKSAFTMTVQSGSDVLYRARFSGFTEKAARAACKLLAAKGMNCFPLAPQS